MDWLKKLDDRVFSPPHTFVAVLSLVAVRLSLFSDDASEIMEAHQDQPRAEASPNPLERRAT